jgi:putative endonuclease
MIRQFTSKTQQLGLQGEDLAVVFLMKHDFSIIERNVHSRNGEIDIIAKKKKMYYFFEVKTGQQGSWFNPADNLTKEKLWKFHRAVEYYVFSHRNLKQKGELHMKHKIQAIIVLLPQNQSGAADALGSYGELKESKIEIIDIT